MTDTINLSSHPRRGRTEGTIHWEGIRTWYAVVGDLDEPGGVPLLVCHGGPGGTHDYLAPLASLARPRRPVVLYDQVGNGRSTAATDLSADAWTVDLFVRELRALVEQLELGDGFHLLGHSWGGQLGLEAAIRGVSGLRSLVLVGTPASASLWRDEADRLIAALCAELGLDGMPEPGTTAAETLGEAYFRTHVYRAGEPPEQLVTTFAAVRENPTVYSSMVGPSEYEVTGSLRNWDVSQALGRIDVPALVITGEHDSATPRVADQVRAGIPGAIRVTLAGCGHMGHLESPEVFNRHVTDFLDDVLAGGPRGGSHDG